MKYCFEGMNVLFIVVVYDLKKINIICMDIMIILFILCIIGEICVCGVEFEVCVELICVLNLMVLYFYIDIEIIDRLLFN